MAVHLAQRTVCILPALADWRQRPHRAVAQCKLGQGANVSIRGQRGHSPLRQVERLVCHASSHNSSSANEAFNLADYVEARISNVKHSDQNGHIIILQLLDRPGVVLPVYIGDFEYGALVKEMYKRGAAPVRPATHDFMKASLEGLGYKVTRVVVTELRGNTYYARVHYGRGGQRRGEPFEEVDVDARPSDAINLAVRFNAAIYVKKDVASKMGQGASAFEQQPESKNDIVRSCREAAAHFGDPMVMHKLQLQVAIAQERYDDAAQLRDRIDRYLASGSNRALSLVVAMETALEDQRFEEAARLRDELKRLPQAL
ncbi:hypothetical protein WJX72_007387 [[Myrmecia] bisecta]|uniref:BFN domain-containing protein n=1 Tax=[Myrmecia] bisecta TaxID=41462 RepID=A0AAW1QAY9_9CHLO